MQSPTIIDTCMYFNEFDILKVRLASCAKHAAMMIVCEAGETHRGAKKPFNLEPRLRELSAYNNLVYVKLDQFPAEFPQDMDWVTTGREPSTFQAWKREAYQRFVLAELVSKMITSGKLTGNEYVFHSDLDEIPNYPLIRQHLAANTLNIQTAVCNFTMSTRVFNVHLTQPGYTPNYPFLCGVRHFTPHTIITRRFYSRLEPSIPHAVVHLTYMSAPHHLHFKLSAIAEGSDNKLETLKPFFCGEWFDPALPLAWTTDTSELPVGIAQLPKLFRTTQAESLYLYNALKDKDTLDPILDEWLKNGPPLPPALPTPRYVISLTTTPKRIAHIRPTLESLCAQTKKPDAIYLAAPAEGLLRTGEKYDVPGWLKELPQVTLVQDVQDYGPATKLMGALHMEKDPNTHILYVDDDMLYHPELLSSLSQCAVYAALGFRGLGVTPDNRSLAPFFVMSKAAAELKIPFMAVPVLEGYAGVLVRRDMLDLLELASILKTPGAPKEFLNDDIVISAYLASRRIPRVCVFNAGGHTTAVTGQLDLPGAISKLHEGYIENTYFMTLTEHVKHHAFLKVWVEDMVKFQTAFFPAFMHLIQVYGRGTFW
jgi:hypothetical protein